VAAGFPESPPSAIPADTQSDGSGAMTTANYITIFRILLVPFIVVELIYYVQTGNELHRLVALLSFAVAAISDGVDGYIARQYNQKSELGAILDPLADKLLLVSVIIILSLDNHPYLDRLPIWLPATVFGRDFILMIGSVLVYYMSGKVDVCPCMIGKTATVLQIATVLWIILKWDDSWGFVWSVCAAVTTGVSGLIYIRDGLRQMNENPSNRNQL
jgi:CDP-diacylglycerol--glycerol-3-phosphate 3-phosphatidyltransferase